MFKKIEVLIDRKAGDLSITASDDRTQVDIEKTLTVEQAWQLVTELNKAIQTLTSQRKIASQATDTNRRKLTSHKTTFNVSAASHSGA